MKVFKRNKSHRLRWHLLQPLTVTFVLLWFGTMFMFTSNTCDRMDDSVKSSARSARNTMEEQYQYYIKNCASGMEEEQAGNILINNLSDWSLGQISEYDGGMAFYKRTYNGYVRSQLAWGWGNQEGVDTGQRWYFSFDEGLDDQGQIALANWIIDNRDTWDYAIFPKTKSDVGNNRDGRFARITGIERPGYEIAVQKIEIIYPDGSGEIMIETSTEGESKTWDFPYLRIRSVLLPSWSSDGKDGVIDMERRLASFREAHKIIDREIEDEWRSVTTEYGFCIGSSDNEGIIDRVAVHCDVFPAAFKQNTSLYVSTALLTFGVLTILSAILSKKVTLPVECLCSEVKEGKCDTETAIEELNTLAIAFNGAQQKLVEQLEREREFTRSAAHELKTPLAILRAHTECAREDIVPEKRSQYLDIVLEESDRMASLVNHLLELARLQSDTKLNIETVALAPLVKEVWEPMTLAIAQKGVTMLMSLAVVSIEGDRECLRKIVDNLASNALRHTPEGGSIHVSVCEEEDMVIITVDNDGLPIPEDDLARIWEPFYRVDKSRNRSDGGTGLGLAIVQEAVMAHGGKCEVENRLGGVCFRISLPKKV